MLLLLHNTVSKLIDVPIFKKKKNRRLQYFKEPEIVEGSVNLEPTGAPGSTEGAREPDRMVLLQRPDLSSQETAILSQGKALSSENGKIALYVEQCRLQIWS